MTQDSYVLILLKMILNALCQRVRLLIYCKRDFQEKPNIRVTNSAAKLGEICLIVTHFQFACHHSHSPTKELSLEEDNCHGS